MSLKNKSSVNLPQPYLLKENAKIKLNTMEKMSPDKNNSKENLHKQYKQNKDSHLNFTAQLKSQIHQLNQTLSIFNKIKKFNCNNGNNSNTTQKEQFYQKNKESSNLFQQSTSGSFMGKVSTNFQQFFDLQQKIKTKQSQINQLERQISMLKQQNWWNMYDKRDNLVNDENKYHNQTILLVKNVENWNNCLQLLINQHRLKLNSFNDLKSKVKAIDQNLKSKRKRTNTSIHNKRTKSESFSSYVYSYQVFRNKFLQKKKENKYLQLKNKLKMSISQSILIKKHKINQKLKVFPSIIAQTQWSFNPGNYNFSNISSIPVNLSYRLRKQLPERKLYSESIAQLPKQINASLKSMQYKLKVLKQALKSQKIKHLKTMTQQKDKLLFLKDQDKQRTQKIIILQSEHNDLNTKVSSIEVKSVRNLNIISKKQLQQRGSTFSKIRSTQTSEFRNNKKNDASQHLWDKEYLTSNKSKRQNKLKRLFTDQFSDDFSLVKEFKYID